MFPVNSILDWNNNLVAIFKAKFTFRVPFYCFFLRGRHHFSSNALSILSEKVIFWFIKGILASPKHKTFTWSYRSTIGLFQFISAPPPPCRGTGKFHGGGGHFFPNGKFHGGRHFWTGNSKEGVKNTYKMLEIPWEGGK